MPVRTAPLALAAAFLLTAQAAATTTVIYVDASATGANDGASWTSAFSDLQDALALAATLPDDDIQIWMAAGTYKPGEPGDSPESSFSLVNGVALYGGFAGGEESLDERDWQTNETILTAIFGSDSSESSRAYTVLIGESLTQGTRLDGLTIRDGSAWEWGFADSGGGLLLVNSTLDIANCTFTANSAAVGGAIYGLDSQVTVSNTQFLDNEGYDAGAIRANGGQWTLIDCAFEGQFAYEVGGAVWASDATITVQNTDFHGNHGGGLGFAGACALGNSESTFQNCTFTENSSYGPSTMWATGSLTLENCAFENNGAGGYTLWGSGSILIVDSIFADNQATAVTWGGSGTAAVIRSTFTGNSCTGSKCGVGGVQIGATFIVIDDSVFHGNASPWGGNLVMYASDASVRNTKITAGDAWDDESGLSFNGGTLSVVNTLIADNIGGVGIHGTSHATFVNCTIIGNTGFTFDNRAGIVIASGAGADVWNTILWANAEGDEQAQVSGPAQIFHSIVQGLDQHAGNNNLSEDPQFIDADGRLSPNSPAIDAGDNETFLALGVELIDLDGNPRIVDGSGDGSGGAVIDIGAFEFQADVPSTPGDLNGNGSVGVADLLILLAAWGECDDCSDCPADLDGDCNVGVSDLLILLANWS